MKNNKALEQLEKLFKPDMQVKLNSNNQIIGTNPLTLTGVQLLLSYTILERDYDQVLKEFSYYGLCWEVIE